MGTNNRGRRRAKKQKRRKAGPPGHPGQGSNRAAGGHHRHPSGGSGGYADEEAVRQAVLVAAEAFRADPDNEYGSRLEALTAIEARAGRAPIERAVAWWVALGLDRAWCEGWQPADVVRAIGRKLGADHADRLAPAVAASGAGRPEAVADDRWAAQLTAIESRGRRGSRRSPQSDVALAVETISVLLYLPPLPRLTATSRRRTPSGGVGSAAMLARVRALLAKAESTTFSAEAEALTAKAQQLMARHAIDQAMVDRGCDEDDEVVGWRIGVDDPYAAAKSWLLHYIAAANRCRSVWTGQLGFSTVFGDRNDLEMVEILFTSLLVQGTEAMLRAGPSVDRSGRSRTRSFRQSFLVAYARRIGERLSAASDRAVVEAADRHGTALLPVLVRRIEAADAAAEAAYPDLVVERGMSVSNYWGWLAGRTAAELASLAVGEELAMG